MKTSLSIHQIMIILIMVLPSVVEAQSGTLITDFGDQGITVMDVEEHDVFYNMSFDPFGEIVAVGRTNYQTTTAEFIIVKFDQAGHLKTSFGENGMIRGSIVDSAYNEAIAVEMDNSGKIYVGISSSKDRGWLVIDRYNANGTPDLSFGLLGRFILNYTDRNWVCNDILLGRDGQLLVAAESGNQNIIFKLDESGIIDSSFAEQGVFSYTSPFGSFHRNIRIQEQEDGKILGAGVVHKMSNIWRFRILRLNPNGELDSLFGEAGIVLDDHPETVSTNTMRGITQQKDGKILAAGAIYNGSVNDAAFVRLLPDGILDPDFAENGLLVLPTNGNNVMYAVEVQMDGQIIAAGDRAIIKLLSDGMLDESFGNSGFVEVTNHISDMKLDQDGNIIVCGSFYNGSNT